MNSLSELDPKLIEKLVILDSVPERSPDHINTGRASFLQEARNLSVTVTPPVESRHISWMGKFSLQDFFQRKGQVPMASSLATVLLVVSLVLGGGGITVAAAQNSQPEQPLYGIKVLSEEVRLGLSTAPETQFQLALEFTNRRADEIQQMFISGSTPSEAILNRFQVQIEQTLQYALNLPEGEVVPALEQTQTCLQAREQTYLQLQANADPAQIRAMEQIRLMLRTCLELIDQGESDPAVLREQLRLREQQRTQEKQGSLTPNPVTSETSAGTGGGNPWTTGTPTPGSGYGPGPGDGDCDNCTATCTPQANSPYATGTSTSGSGNGSGNSGSPTSVSTSGSENRNGAQPTASGGNQPTDAGPQPTQAQGNQPTPGSVEPTPPGNQPTPGGSDQQPTSSSGSPGGNH